jgi:hypothetical protein
MLDGFYEFPVPQELQEVASRHQQHVAELIDKLRSAGLDDRLIERSVDQLIASYRAELMGAVKALKGPSYA